MIEKRWKARRDHRLLIALLLLFTSMIAALVQVWILHLYLDAAITGHWDYFARMFSVQLPPSGPTEFCFGRCVPDLPFLAGWIAIVSFLLGLAILTYSWWKPRQSDAE